MNPFSHRCLAFLLLSLLFFPVRLLQAQEPGMRDPLLDTTRNKPSKFDILPAISYSPETKLTLGVIGYYNFDLYKTDPNTRFSFVNFLAVWTTANQILVESNWEIFTDGNEWRFRGKAFYNKYPDRNYGLGNEAHNLVIESNEEDGQVVVDTLNYLRFNTQRIAARPVFQKKITNNLYAGLQLEIENLWDYEAIPTQFTYATPADSIGITRLPVIGWRTGIGFNILYDSRDNILNPLRGSYFEFNNHWFVNWLGGDYRYSNYRFDFRHYLNPVLNHTLAFRAVLNFRNSRNEEIPIRGLSRVGGLDFVRGYFFGTYQDNHMAAFETEYRLPFWKEGTEAPLYQFWKRLGVVAFMSGAQVWGPNSDTQFGFERFRLAGGMGLRILFNRKSRLNMRIDYAMALAPNSGGPGQRQTGLYFFLAEAF